MNVNGPHNHSHSTGPIGQGSPPVHGPHKPKKSTTIAQKVINYISSVFSHTTQANHSLEGRVQAALPQSLTSRIIGATLHTFVSV